MTIWMVSFAAHAGFGERALFWLVVGSVIALRWVFMEILGNNDKRR